MSRLALTRSLPVLFCLAVPALGCPGDDKETGNTETDADTDADADADADADTDTDTDADVNYVSIEGTATFTDTVNGFTNCDVDATVSGTPYTGDCFDCTFGFSMEGAVTRDGSSPACPDAPAAYTYVQSGGYSDLTLLYWDEYYGYYNFAISQYYYYFEGYGTYGPFYNYLGYDGNPYGSASFDGSAFAVVQSWDYYYQYYKLPTQNLCAAPQSLPGDGSHGDVSGTGALTCTAWTLHDVWTFTVETPGPVTVTVDTVSDGSAFDPYMAVVDPSGCTISTSDDAFECTFPPPKWGCPSISFEATEAGTYAVDVTSYGDCAGTSANYAVYVSGGTGLVQTVDDEDFSTSNVGGRTYARDFELNATLTAE